jgi:hypothetical protein
VLFQVSSKQHTARISGLTVLKYTGNATVNESSISSAVAAKQNMLALTSENCFIQLKHARELQRAVTRFSSQKVF